MKEKLEKIIGGEYGNYIYPFFWPDENDTSGIAEEVEAVYNSGIRGLCIEARPFEDFGGETWWLTVQTILEEAKKRGMKVWILDDKHFPTGYANGYIEHKYPGLRRRWLFEHHFDVYGEKKGCYIRLPFCDDDERILFACAYKRTGEAEELEGEPLVFSVKEHDEFLRFDVPAGLWRVFIIMESRNAEHRGHGWHIDMLSEKSAAVLIEAVYEEHYKYLSGYFGNVLTGFFSDEPCFAARHTERWGLDSGFYDGTVGQPGMSLPWNESVVEKMRADTENDVFALLPLLWYSHADAPETRLSYMNAVTTLWNENFSYALGNWCRSHGLIYTGHIIEDLNAHTRLSASTGHYFRGLSGQDISGIDIVLHQVQPGMSDYINAASVARGISDGRFYHYSLGQLASSLARFEPRMQGRAMCEMFGAYGWAEGAPMMKWIADFLLVRGINYFVPHAFSVKYPFDDCPPHFYARGCNPQYDGFTAIMHYVNKATELLKGAVKKTAGAIFYFAENEWMSGKDCMVGDVPAKALYDAHIDYDIVSLDYLENAVIADKKLIINGTEHTFLVIPEAKYYPGKLVSLVNGFVAQGLPVYTVTEKSGNYGNILGKKIAVQLLAGEILAEKLAYDYGKAFPKLRIAEFDSAEECVFMLFNEAPAEKAEGLIRLPVSGAYSELHFLNDAFYGGCSADGMVNISLLPGESVIFVFDGKESSFAAKDVFNSVYVPEIQWNIDVLETGIDSTYRNIVKGGELSDITALDGMSRFSGKIRYSGSFPFNEKQAVLDIGQVGYTASLCLNGKNYPVRVCAPYAWDISDALIDGDNHMEIVAANTLSNRIYDSFSTFIALESTGVQGPVKLYGKK